ncbi:MAG TPA: TetR/AcrR family transcriptional regulator, partial [Micromonosporaceae bacterium]|nr:TetR/AcrR family transcriptional regulator [Micromonosporaceae bacterium]
MSVAPTFKRLPRAVREQQMLDAAVRVFSRKGFHAASMDDIAESAGISKPMLYAYLGSKEALFIACVHREGTRMMEAIVAVAEPGLPPDEQLWRGLRAFFGFVGAHRDGWSVLYRQARGEQRFAGELAAMRARIVDVIAGMLRRAVRDQGRDIRDSEL